MAVSNRPLDSSDNWRHCEKDGRVDTSLRVGTRAMPWDEARSFVTAYTAIGSEYAYPAYDGYPGSGSESLNGADLLAPILLNVRHISIRTYNALLDCLDELDRRLADLRDVPPLHKADTATIEALADLFGILDRRELPGVRLTVLSKDLHRKRPDLIPLYDQNIKRCYLGGTDPRIETVKGRSWTDFARSWIPEVQVDLKTQLPAWVALAELAPGPTPVTPLRTLDMIGWRLGAE